MIGSIVTVIRVYIGLFRSLHPLHYPLPEHLYRLAPAIFVALFRRDLSMSVHGRSRASTLMRGPRMGPRPIQQ